MLPLRGCWRDEGCVGQDPHSQPGRSSFWIDSICAVLAQACLFLSLSLKQPLALFCSSCLPRRGTIFFLNQVSGLHVQLCTLLWCHSDDLFDLSGTGLPPPTQTSLQSGNAISTLESSGVFKSWNQFVIVKLEVPLEPCYSKFRP